MRLDCAIIGGGPAGLNAALVLGRARRSIVLFDDNKPRNAVTRESHGFITRDGVKPVEFRAIAHQELSKYPSIEIAAKRVTAIAKKGASLFEIETETGDTYTARTVIIATGLKEQLPAITEIADYYGQSLFSCPYCDGWEQRDQPLVAIVDTADHAFHMGMMVYQWSKDLAICLNGGEALDAEREAKLRSKGIQVYGQRIQSLKGSGGKLSGVVFEDGAEIARTGGFVTTKWEHSGSFAEQLGCALNEHGGIAADDFGRTSVDSVYAAGDASVIVPAQLIAAAAGGSRAAMGVNAELMHADF
ncbi:NAD(P)/FAD-dependent oxidoreductase [Paenibacillus sp. NEAU-GSW1]|uniref:NAD(P)/FAD-dependent oxidoreductase n=1 Tax=Paenibacillus sp. NEAU-GSW1 TaxID=2682486 RepID=UPI0012E116EC|nr:NAD(P)/FAD-dependent oxidoreductase [Paenibacillus sp. NEAU-GSW1]MUT66117.1 NAD(P)/FAD-dependent oxidoreductase [Paenibacillus sp. NEAU-GSW1]